MKEKIKKVLGKIKDCFDIDMVFTPARGVLEGVILVVLFLLGVVTAEIIWQCVICKLL